LNLRFIESLDGNDFKSELRSKKLVRAVISFRGKQETAIKVVPSIRGNTIVNIKHVFISLSIIRPPLI
jgi:hypothetical protein